MKSILDPKFKYVDSYGTDLRKTFARIRREQREARAAAAAKPLAVVQPLHKKKEA